MPVMWAESLSMALSRCVRRCGGNLAAARAGNVETSSRGERPEAPAVAKMKRARRVADPFSVDRGRYRSVYRREAGIASVGIGAHTVGSVNPARRVPTRDRAAAAPARAAEHDGAHRAGDLLVAHRLAEEGRDAERREALALRLAPRAR